MDERALKSDLVRVLTAANGWPPHKALTEWIRTQSGAKDLDGSIRNETYGHIRRGHQVAPRYLVAFVAYYLDCLEFGRQLQFITTVTGFLAKQGVHDPLGVPQQELLDYLITEENPDAMMGEFSALVRQFHRRGLAERNLQLVPCSDLDEVARWVYIEVARGEGLNGPRLGDDEAITVATDKLQFPIQRYADQLRAMQRINPWTVVYSMGKTEPVGFTSLHPVRPEVYEAVRRGELASYEIEESDMVFPSRHLVIEGIANRPAPSSRCPNATSWSLLLSIVCQAAYLTWSNGPLSNEPIHVLAPAGTPLNERRLVNARYSKVADSMAVRKIKVYERIIHFSYKHPTDWMFHIFLRGLGAALREAA